MVIEEHSPFKKTRGFNEDSVVLLSIVYFTYFFLLLCGHIRVICNIYCRKKYYSNINTFIKFSEGLALN